ncbi:MAG: hypothetical protein AB8G86_09260, partial [Saprospiraceae bacterium]
NTDDNFVEYISLKPNPFFALFKSILIEKYDYKEVKQNYFKEYDWIWKFLVYLSILDFYLIKKLLDKKIYSDSLSSIIEEKKLFTSTGVNIGGGDKNDASHLVNLPYIDNKNKDLNRYYINYRKESLWTKEVVHRPRRVDAYKAPVLLIKNSLLNNFKLVASILSTDAVYTKNVFGIKSYSDAIILKKILGVLTSDLSNYFLFISGTSTGIEREQIMFEELYPFPIILSDEIAETVERLLSLNNEKHNSINDNYYDDLIQKEEDSLNHLIYNLYKFSAKDKYLLDYAFNISIPSFKMGTSVSKSYKKFPPYKVLKFKSQELELYANILINHYNRLGGNIEKIVHATIYCTENVIAINFDFKNELLIENIIWKQEGKGYLDFLATTAFQKVSSHLFIQKDIKGIRKDSFYVIKPNQVKLWHPAIAHLDILEFDNKMINLELNQTENVPL